MWKCICKCPLLFSLGIQPLLKASYVTKMFSQIQIIPMEKAMANSPYLPLLLGMMAESAGKAAICTESSCEIPSPGLQQYRELFASIMDVLDADPCMFEELTAFLCPEQYNYLKGHEKTKGNSSSGQEGGGFIWCWEQSIWKPRNV